MYFLKKYLLWYYIKIVDDENIDNLTRKDLSKLIILVPQSPFLIAGTIFENITYRIDKEVSIEEVEEVE